METMININNRILSTLLLIYDQYPELLGYIDELTITLPCNKYPKINSDKLAEYHSHLDHILTRYIECPPNYYKVHKMQIGQKNPLDDCTKGEE